MIHQHPIFLWIFCINLFDNNSPLSLSMLFITIVIITSIFIIIMLFISKSQQNQDQIIDRMMMGPGDHSFHHSTSNSFYNTSNMNVSSQF